MSTEQSGITPRRADLGDPEDMIELETRPAARRARRANGGRRGRRSIAAALAATLTVGAVGAYTLTNGGGGDKDQAGPTTPEMAIPDQATKALESEFVERGEQASREAVRSSVNEGLAADDSQARQKAMEAQAESALQDVSKLSADKRRQAMDNNLQMIAQQAERLAAASEFLMPVIGRLTSPFGPRLNPITQRSEIHDGTDIAAACGTPMYAPTAGKVKEKYYSSGYGHRLMIDHGDIDGVHVVTGYNHATGYVVEVGAEVEQGQLIGYVGTTGHSTGCHLHLMVWENDQKVDGMQKYFSADGKFAGAVTKGATTEGQEAQGEKTDQ